MRQNVIKLVVLSAVGFSGCALPTYDYRGVHVTLAEEECETAYIKQQIQDGVDEVLDTVGLATLPTSLVAGTEPEAYTCQTQFTPWDWAFSCLLWLRDDSNRPQLVLRCDRMGEQLADHSLYEPRKALSHWLFHRYLLEEGFDAVAGENKFHEDARWQSYGYYCWEDHRILDNTSGAGTAASQCGW